MKLIALFIPLLFVLAACSTTPTPGEETQTPVAERQSQLTALFDRLSGDEAGAKKAAAQAARLDATDRRFLASLWGTRSSAPQSGMRLGDALAEAGAHEEAFAWYLRTFRVLPAQDSRRPYVRYEMARACLAMGKPDDAINLLANRLDPTPLPEDLRAKYDALLEAASKASR